MHLELGQHVFSSDGHDIGAIKHLILDPASATVKTFVVEQGWILPADTEIPLEAVLGDGRDVLSVRYTAEQIADLPRFDESQYSSVPQDQASAFMGYSADGLMWPNGYAFPPLATAGSPLPAPVVDGELAMPLPPEVQERLRQQDESNAVISAGDDVISRDGEKVGEVQSVVFDSVTGRTTILTVRQGWLFHKDWEMSADVIASVDDGVVYLNVDKDQLEVQRNAAPPLAGGRQSGEISDRH